MSLTHSTLMVDQRIPSTLSQEHLISRLSQIQLPNFSCARGRYTRGARDVIQSDHSSYFQIFQCKSIKWSIERKSQRLQHKNLAPKPLTGCDIFHSVLYAAVCTAPLWSVKDLHYWWLHLGNPPMPAYSRYPTEKLIADRAKLQRALSGIQVGTNAHTSTTHTCSSTLRACLV